MNWFKKIFSTLFSLFRDGLEKFLTENIEKAINIAKTAVANGGYNSTHELVQLIWVALRAEYPSTAGTWLSIIANLAVDALKKAKVI